jgi:soluble lytic murein transglycosylase-like protein
MKSILKLISACAMSTTCTSILYAYTNYIPSEYTILKIGKRYELVLPDTLSQSMSYEQEVEQFSQQLVRAFDISIEKARKYSPVIIRADINTGLSEIKIASLIMTKSTFRHEVFSSVGAYGSTQINPFYWNEFCENKSLDIFNFEGNILCGAEIVSYLQNQFCDGRLTCALEHYNVRRGNLLASIKYRQTGKRYTKKISNYSNQLESTILNDDVYAAE